MKKSFIAIAATLALLSADVAFARGGGGGGGGMGGMGGMGGGSSAGRGSGDYRNGTQAPDSAIQRRDQTRDKTGDLSGSQDQSRARDRDRIHQPAADSGVVLP